MAMPRYTNLGESPREWYLVSRSPDGEFSLRFLVAGTKESEVLPAVCNIKECGVFFKNCKIIMNSSVKTNVKDAYKDHFGDSYTDCVVVNGDVSDSIIKKIFGQQEKDSLKRYKVIAKHLKRLFKCFVCCVTSSI